VTSLRNMWRETKGYCRSQTVSYADVSPSRWFATDLRPVPQNGFWEVGTPLKRKSIGLMGGTALTARQRDFVFELALMLRPRSPQSAWKAWALAEHDRYRAPAPQP
jgi:hypothetical protein